MVRWHEAIVFCRWLSGKLGQMVTLPTEMQWQRAAQGDDGRKYPWGNEFDKTRCNTYESGIGRTTAVDHYPKGKSPFGVFDMAGNVWEWCLNEHPNPHRVDLGGWAQRVLRGGSWFLNSYYARATYRDYYDPIFRPNFGFRVVSECALPSNR